MHEVKVFDGSGKLKKVISVKALNIRSKKQLETPLLYRKYKSGGRPYVKSATSTIKGQTTKP